MKNLRIVSLVLLLISFSIIMSGSAIEMEESPNFEWFPNDGSYEEAAYNETDDFGQDILTIVRFNDNISMSKNYVNGILSGKAIINYDKKISYDECVFDDEKDMLPNPDSMILDSIEFEMISVRSTKEQIEDGSKKTDFSKFQELGADDFLRDKLCQKIDIDTILAEIPTENIHKW